jgi:serine/threonine-protein kinase HipA
MSAISGVQPKAFVRVDDTGTLVLAVQGGTHILKPAQTQWPELPQNENACMTLAEDFGMTTAPHALLRMADGEWAYLTRRFDRRGGMKIHKEDMAQVLGKPVSEKYDGSLEKVGQAILDHSTFGGLDAVGFFERTLLCFLLGNGDMHLKNWSLLRPDSKDTRLAPCYDWVSTALYLPEGEESALTLNGKRNRIGRGDFERLADHLGLHPRARENAFARVLGRRTDLLAGIKNSFLSDHHKRALSDIVEIRLGRLDQKSLPL